MNKQEDISVAIVGQPNGGKSTIFQLLTKIHQETGNYPGVTFDARTGHYHEGEKRIEVVDLPGAYSFSSPTPEERIAKNFLLLDCPEVVLAVVDAAHFRRSLSFVLELLELQLPLIVCLNFMDVVPRRGIKFDVAALEKLLNVEVVPCCAVKGKGIDELRTAILNVGSMHEHTSTGWKIDYGPAMEQTLAAMEKAIRTKEHLSEDFSPRWLAVKLMENDREARRIVEHHTHDDTWRDVLDFADEKFNGFIQAQHKSSKKLILECRNQLVHSIDQATTTRIRPQTYHVSDRIDAWVCHPLWGPLILFVLMILIFQVTFNLADGWHWFPSISFSPWSFSLTTPVEWINGIFHSWIPEHVERLLRLTDPASISFLRHGVLAGVGGVVQFLPIIFIMFTILAMLEQSGYIARVAMVMDSFMRRFGLQGRSILPLVLGGGISGGCAVPAILTTRSITNFRQRTLTILAIPMLNCGGKVPVFAMLVAAFFSAWQGLVMAGIVFFSWAMALCSAWIFGHTVLKGNELPLLLELPSYQIPSMGEVLASSSRQSIEFLKKAGTVILGTNMFLWCLMSWPGTDPKPEDLPQGSPNPPTQALKADWRLEHSYAAQIGRLLEPVSHYAGFSWKDNVALIGGIAAKELIVSSMITMYLANENTAASKTDGTTSDVSSQEARPNDQEKKGMQLRSVLKNSPEWSRAKALAMLVFIMFFAPCSGTLVAIYRVTGSLKWPFISFVYNTALAFVLAVILFQVFNRFQ